MENNMPNLFLVGSPKCATTALSTYLSEHPDIFFSHPKEPNYFNTDFSKKHRRFYNEKEYINTCLKDYSNEKYAAEGTVWYLYSNKALENIKHFNKDAKIIAIIRDPAELLYSLHSTLLKSAQENIKSFSNAWNITLKQKENRNVPVTCRDVKLLMYHEIGAQGKHIKKLFSLYKKENIFVTNFNHVTQSTKETLKNIYEFLEIKPYSLEEYNDINSNEEVKSAKVSYLLGELGRNNFLYNLKRRIGLKKGSIFIKPIQKFNLIKKDRPPLNNDLKNEILNYFSEDKEILKTVVDEQLIYW
jgi:hypothetical protein